MPLGTIMDLDTVIQFSGNETTELLNILRGTGNSWLKFQTLAGVDEISWDYIVGPGIEVKFAHTVRYYLGPAHAFEFRTSGGTVIFSMNAASISPHFTVLPPATSPNVDLGAAAPNQFRSLYLSQNLNIDGSIVGSGWIGNLVVDGNIRMDGAASRTIFGGDSTTETLILRANTTDSGPTLELPGNGVPIFPDGSLAFVAANKGRIIDDGSSLKILYGAGPDIGLGVGCCSGAAWFKDIQNDGIHDALGERYFWQDAALAFPFMQFFDIFGIFRTSGDVCQIVGDITSLTTGRLLAIYNNASGGPAGTPIFKIDKLGKVFIGDSTGAAFGNIEKTLTHYIFDSGAARLSIRIGGTPVIYDNGVSELALGHATLAPKLPVVTTAQRNALTATVGMVVWHTGPPATAQVYNGVAWVNL